MENTNVNGRNSFSSITEYNDIIYTTGGGINSFTGEEKGKPSFLEMSLIMATGKTVRELIEAGELLNGEGKPYEMDMFSEDEKKGFENFELPGSLVNDIKDNGPLYFWREKDKYSTPFAINYYAEFEKNAYRDYEWSSRESPEELFAITEMVTDAQRIQISNAPISRNTVLNNVPEPSFSEKAGHYLRSFANFFRGLVGVEPLKDPDNVAAYYNQDARQSRINSVAEKVLRENGLNAETYDPEEVDELVQDGIEKVGVIIEERKKGLSQSQILENAKDRVTPEKETVSPVKPESGKAAPESEPSDKVGIEEAVETYKEYLKKNNYVINDDPFARDAVAVLIVKAVLDKEVHDGNPRMTDNEFEEYVERISTSVAYETYLEENYTPEIGRQLAESNNRKLPFDEFEKIERINTRIMAESEVPAPTAQEQKQEERMEEQPQEAQSSI